MQTAGRWQRLSNLTRVLFAFRRLLTPAFLLGAALLAAQAPPGSCNNACLVERAQKALAAGRHVDYLGAARQFAARAPDHPGVIYAVARGFAFIVALAVRHFTSHVVSMTRFALEAIGAAIVLVVGRLALAMGRLVRLPGKA